MRKANRPVIRIRLVQCLQFSLEQQGPLTRVKCRHGEADYAPEHELRQLEPHRAIPSATPR